MIKKLSDRAISFISYAVLTIFSLLCTYPLLLIFMVSISDELKVQLHGYKIIPEAVSFKTYIYLWERSGDSILNAYAMSVLVTVIGTLSSMGVTSMFAYSISQKNVRYRNAISLFSYFTVIFSAGIVPWYIVCVQILHINNTFFGLFLPYLVNVWNLFLLRNYFQSVPDSLAESAKIDGAGDFYIFIRIFLPVSKTALLTVGLFYALQYWNDWWLPIMLITKRTLFPLQYYLFSTLTNVQALSNNTSLGITANIPLPTETVKMAVTVVAVGPIIFLYPIVQKYFVKGIIVGAVKG